MKNYLYHAIENGKSVYYKYESNSRKNTTKHWCDWNRQLGKFVDKFNADNVILDNEKNRADNMINEEDVF